MGREQAGFRPALVLSHAAYNRKARLMLACPITNQQKGYPFEVVLPLGMRTTGCILADHLKFLDWHEWGVKFPEEAPSAVVSEVLARIKPLIF
ncbi:type II toxin-antitoxin system PemK/MazF family toxin [Leptolyngbya sp. FACHB-261]|uniref:type II toxin-antitoxin system PemK/MazF family toxin n=1 Tax=Leptolyngbya sp. FACHB-261 TaxID=2692806 RepID=UPI001683A029|nr:type II toxin-antitoxin system PemK/MazF family toxin [Leptolyngbya sp. FACHB-261]MBD2105155.1 type II toxin-antitoxin system PemK/MazF family toxin [Leptolyngbya sp. FACHB-261]